MKPKEVILKAFEGGKTDRLPVTLFGAGMWSIKGWGTSFEALSRDAEKMTSMLVDMSAKLQCDVVYAGSGYNNFHASALGGKIKWREIGAPDLENHFVSSEDDLAKLKISDLDKDEIIQTVMKVVRKTKAKVGDTYAVTMTAWGPFTLGARLVG
ncbi:MAG TPA: uroporphyrinogen decarboxylase family protein, partial [Nitrospirota bacterium]|nr:uroporphyrinogen decarboxylase family protein [Nitrospirota bacterium]